MEMREIFLRDGTSTGRIVEKHNELNDGEYYLHAVIILTTREGKYIMQQRSLKARWHAGRWDVTGGGVSAGETSAQAAAREAYEELGVKVRPEDCRFVFREVTDWRDDPGGLIMDMYFAYADVPEGGFVIAEREVNDVKLVSYEEFIENIGFNKSPEFMRAIEEIENSR